MTTPNHVHLSPMFSWTHLATTISMVVSTVLFISRMQTDISINSEKIKSNYELQQQINNQQINLIREIRDQQKIQSNKLDRLIINFEVEKARKETP